MIKDEREYIVNRSEAHVRKPLQMSLSVGRMPLGYHGEGAGHFLPILVAELSNLDKRVVFLSSRRGRRRLLCLCGSLRYSNEESRCMFRCLEWKWGNWGSSATHRFRLLRGGGKSTWSDGSQLKHFALCGSAARTADRRRKRANTKTVHAPTPQIVQKVNFKRQQAPSGRFLYAGEMNAFQEAWSPACALVYPYGLIKEDDIVGSARRLVDDCWSGGHDARLCFRVVWLPTVVIREQWSWNTFFFRKQHQELFMMLYFVLLCSVLHSKFANNSQNIQFMPILRWKASFAACVLILGRKISWDGRRQDRSLEDDWSRDRHKSKSHP